jgi:hypothetical protein
MTYLNDIFTDRPQLTDEANTSNTSVQHSAPREIDTNLRLQMLQYTPIDELNCNEYAPNNFVPPSDFASTIRASLSGAHESSGYEYVNHTLGFWTSVNFENAVQNECARAQAEDAVRSFAGVITSIILDRPRSIPKSSCADCGHDEQDPNSSEHDENASSSRLPMAPLGNRSLHAEHHHLSSTNRAEALYALQQQYEAAFLGSDESGEVRAPRNQGYIRARRNSNTPESEHARSMNSFMPSFNAMLSLPLHSLGVPPLVFEILTWENAGDLNATNGDDGLAVIRFLIENWYDERQGVGMRNGTRVTSVAFGNAQNEKERLLSIIRRACIQRRDAKDDGANILYQKLRRVVEPYTSGLAKFCEGNWLQRQINPPRLHDNTESSFAVDLVYSDIAISSLPPSTRVVSPFVPDSTLRTKGKEKEVVPNTDSQCDRAFIALINIPDFPSALKSAQPSTCPCHVNGTHNSVKLQSHKDASASRREGKKRISTRMSPYSKKETTRPGLTSGPAECSPLDSIPPLLSPPGPQRTCHEGRCTLDPHSIELEFIASSCAWSLTITENGMTLALLDCPPKWMTRPLQTIDGEYFTREWNRKVGALVDAQVSLIISGDADEELNFVFPKAFLSPRSSVIDCVGPKADPESLQHSVSLSLPSASEILHEDQEYARLGLQLTSFNDDRILNAADNSLLVNLRVDVEPAFVQQHYSSVVQQMYDAGTEPPETVDGFSEVSLPSISTASWSRVDSEEVESSAWSDIGDMRMPYL